VAVTGGEACKEIAVELEPRRGVDRVEPVTLVDRLPQHETPASVPPLEEVVEAAGADDVADDAVHLGALGARHLGLPDRTVAGDVDGGAAEEVKDADAPLEPFTADADELVGRPLKPRRHHPAVVVPDAAEALPVARVAPHDPVLDQLSDRRLV